MSVLIFLETDDNSFATDATQSDVFHSIINSVRDEDRTIRSDDGSDEEVTLDLDTPDDMEDSILERKFLRKISAPLKVYFCVSYTWLYIFEHNS